MLDQLSCNWLRDLGTFMSFHTVQWSKELEVFYKTIQVKEEIEWTKKETQKNLETRGITKSIQIVDRRAPKFYSPR